MKAVVNSVQEKPAPLMISCGTGMPFDIRFGPRADRFLQSADNYVFDRISEKIQALSLNPQPRGVKKVIGEESVYRIRVGNYRILYSVESGENVLLIVNIDKRSRVYHR